MKIAIHYTDTMLHDNFAWRWFSALESLGINVKKLDFKHADIIQNICDVDGVMWHWAHNADDKQSANKILAAIEYHLNIPTFPNYSTRWHYDEKISQHYLFQSINAPEIPTWVFWTYDDARLFIKTCEYPLIFKLSSGAGSSNVIKINNLKEARRLTRNIFLRGIQPYTFNEFSPKIVPRSFQDIKRLADRSLDSIRYIFLADHPKFGHHFNIHKNYIYFQKYLPNNHHDIRITVIGDRAFGFIRFNRPGDFRASGSGNLDTNPQNIPTEAIRISHEISQKCGFQSMAYDFLYDTQGNLRIGEISYCFVNQAVRDCPGYWDRKLNWHEGHIWPEDAHVSDFLSYIEAKVK
jgi:glutathione synthase/RimK-type ligase-like ATP-grasp enzyme